MVIVAGKYSLAAIMTLLFSPKQLQFFLLFSLLSPSATSSTFNVSSFTPDDVKNISTEGDAYIDKQFIRLTSSAVDANKKQSVGRTTYRESFLIRENATGKLAGFTTNFAFVIDSQGKNSYANGLAFFLAPSGSLLNRTLGKGSLSIGLPVNASKTHQYPFVAVEFDIHQNNLSAIRDPFGDHVGIDVNSLKSTVTKPWNGSISDGQHNTARISYDSQSKNLSVSFTPSVNGTQVMRYLDYIVDLNPVLA